MTFTARSSLIVVDMQRDFVEPSASAAVRGAPSCIAPIAAAAVQVRAAGGIVVWVTRAYDADGANVEPSRRARFLLAPFVVTGSSGAELCDGLNPEPCDLHVLKPRWSAFFETGLATSLRARGIEHVVLSGVDLSRCVRATMMDALSFDFDTALLAGGIATRSPEALAANLADAADLGVPLHSSSA